MLDPVPELPAAQPAPSRWAPVKLILREIVETVVLAAVVYVVVNFATVRIRVESVSMQPNLHAGDYVLVDKVSYQLGAPQRGDIVVFTNPNGSGPDLIKRVMGLPGETVNIAGGQVHINGRPLTEPYLAAAPNYQYACTLAADQYLVLGDNRNNSSDSHLWGPLDRNRLLGKAVVIYWPLNAVGLVPHYAYSAVN